MEETNSDQIVDGQDGENAVEPEALDDVQTKVEGNDDVVYAASIIGFGTLQAAMVFYNRVKKYGIPLIIKERESKTKKGRVIVWYQAVTQEYADKKELEAVIEKLKKREIVNDIRIVEKRKVIKEC